VAAMGKRLLLAWLVACWPGWGIAAPLPVEEVAPGVFVYAGAHEETSAANRGAIANVGFIVGRRCVAVVDTGGSLAVGQGLREAVRVRTELPVCYVINTHVHPDHLLGNAAFAGDKPSFVGHARLPAALAARARTYLAALSRALGPEAGGTPLVPPDTLVQDTLTLDLGGRRLALRAWPTAHTDQDLTVFDEQTGTLWLGDLLFVERIPAVDGSARGWLQVMASLRGLAVQRAVPGHGPATVAWPAALDAQERYLATLVEETRRALQRRLTLQQAVDSVGHAERGKWRLFDLYHPRNVTAVYTELEWED
jgi:quinoprotein relay system zinc metallohydrolase 2